MHLYFAIAAIVIVFTRATTTVPEDMSGIDLLLRAAAQSDGSSPTKRQKTGPPAEGGDDEKKPNNGHVSVPESSLRRYRPRSEVAEERRIIGELLQTNPGAIGMHRKHGFIRARIAEAGIHQPRAQELSRSIALARAAHGITDPRRAESERRSAIVRQVVGDNPTATDRELCKRINDRCEDDAIPAPDRTSLRRQVRGARKALARTAMAGTTPVP